MTAEDIRIILAEVAAGRGGPPCRLRSDNGPEFVAQVVRPWLEGTGSGSAVRGTGEPLGRTVTRSHFIARFATNSWTARSSRANRKPESIRRALEGRV